MNGTLLRRIKFCTANINSVQCADGGYKEYHVTITSFEVQGDKRHQQVILVMLTIITRPTHSENAFLQKPEEIAVV